MEVSHVEITQQKINEKENDGDNSDINLPITDDLLSSLQSQDMFYSHILTQIEKGNIKEGHIYVVQNKILKRYVTD